MKNPSTEEFLTVSALPAGPGDCLWIEYGAGKTPHHCLLIDTGVDGTLAFFKPKLLSMPDGVTCTVVITHIDDDHIGCATALLSDPALFARVSDVWFNGRVHCGPIAGLETFGVANALELESLLSEGKLPWNCIASAGPLVMSSGKPPITTTLPGGMQVTVLGPTPDQLSELGKAWDIGVEKLREKEAKRAKEVLVPEGMEAFGVPAIDVPGLAAFIGIDKSVTNCSSIVLLLEFAGRRLLLTGDYPAESLESVAEKMGIRDIDFLKVSHHGSRKNTSQRLIETLRPRAALISANGKHGHPNDECLAMLASGIGDKTIYLNYPHERLEKWKCPNLKARYRYEIVFGDGASDIEL